MAEKTYSTPALEQATLDQLQLYADQRHLHLSTRDLEHFQGAMEHLFGLYDAVDKMAECTPDVLSHENLMIPTGYEPAPADNPYNAWVRRLDIVGSKTGKLAGKTLAVKDCIHVAGVPLLNGSKFMRGFVSPFNAFAVNRVLDAGGRIKGKSTCENMCLSGQSFTSASGPVLNPFDKTRSAGGSSSGSAVLVAVGEVDMALGTDAGGSIRLPSCYCGIVGMKPTRGLVSITGSLPFAAFMDHLGPMARTVKDCALLLEVIAGSDGGLDLLQPASLTVPNYSQLLTGDVTGLRVGLLKECFDGCEEDVAQTVRQAALSLSTLGVSVEEFSTSVHNRAAAISTLLCLEGVYDVYLNAGASPLNTLGFKETLTDDFMFKALRSSSDQLPAGVKLVMLMGSHVRENYGCHFYAKAVNLLRQINAEYDELFKRYDVIIMPTIKGKAPKIPKAGINVQEYTAAVLGNATNTVVYDATGHPALNINAGFSTTQPPLPIGMMLIGRHFDDVTVLRLAHAYEQLRDASSAYREVEMSLAFKVKS